MKGSNPWPVSFPYSPSLPPSPEKAKKEMKNRAQGIWILKTRSQNVAKKNHVNYYCSLLHTFSCHWKVSQQQIILGKGFFPIKLVQFWKNSQVFQVLLEAEADEEEASFRSFSRLLLKEEEEGSCFRSFSTLFRERIPSVCCCRVLSTVEVVHTRTLLGIDQNGGRL